MEASDQPDLHEVFGDPANPDDLDPELEEYLTEGPDGHTFIQHPLVYSVLHAPTLNRVVNDLLRRKKKVIEEYVGAERWSSVVWAHERPHRLTAFATIQHNLTNVEWWSLLGSIWIDSENIWQNERLWERYLHERRPDRDAFMSGDQDDPAWDSAPLEVYENLPKEFTVYRGYSKEGRDEGFSWTLNEQIAGWFAQRFTQRGDRPRVVEGVVRKESVIGFLNGRHEEEIVVAPENVIVSKTTALDPRSKVLRPEVEGANDS